MKARKFLILIALAALAGAGAWWLRTTAVAPAASVSATRQPLYWYDPMVPDQHFDAPGKSPFMDMQLVPKYADDEAPAPAPAAQPAAVDSAPRKPLYWYDPMVPDQHFDAPGKSPFMDMQLVPKYADDEAPAAPPGGSDDAPTRAAPGPEAGLRIDPRMQQSLGLRLATVERQRLSQPLRAVGTVSVDEHRIEAVTARAPGWVERLAVRAVGDPVRRGALLASVYAPELLAAQEEYLLALRSGDASLSAAARLRLTGFGLSEAQIARVQASGKAERRIDYHAPFDGYVMRLGAREGAAVMPGTPLFELASLDSVWIEVAVPEAQAAAVRSGDAATVELVSRPGEQRRGSVDYIYPELESSTRSLRLRVQVDNRGLLLRPGMYASVSIATAARAEALSVPSEAVIRTGLRSVVLVVEPGDRFRPVIVQTGIEAGARTEILAGLAPGQQVVASGQFLIDSEASLRGVLERLAPSADGPHEAAMPMRMPEAKP